MFRTTMVAVALGALSAGSTAASFLSTDTDDNLSPASTPVSINFAPDMSLLVNGGDQGGQCTLSMVAKTNKAGLGFYLAAAPTFSQCPGFSVNTTGKWSMRFHDTANDETAREGAGTGGDRIHFTIPSGGMTFTFSGIPGCTVSVTGGVMGAVYAGENGGLQWKGSAPTSATGCTTNGSVIFFGSSELSPAVQDVG